MPNTPELSIDQLAAALTERVNKHPDLRYTSQFVDLVMGKPVMPSKGRPAMNLSADEKRDWLTTLDAYLTHLKDADPKAVLLPKFAKLKAEHDREIPVGDFDTPLGRQAGITLSKAAYIELHALWADRQPL